VSAAMSKDSEERSEESRSRSVFSPLDVLVITRERLQDTLDDAVRRGRMTRDDASDLLAEIVRRAVMAPTDRVRKEVRRVTGAIDGGLPIADYDELTAAQIVGRLDTLSVDEQRRVRDYERRNANRKTVLAALDAKLA
jgi:polyhydroxyalkanoate synthesis regulator phasin